MPFIIYPQASGQVAVIIPADPSISIQDLVEKDVPTGTPYAIIDELPSNFDNTFFNSYEFDQTLGLILNFTKAQSQQTSTLNQLIYNESAHSAVKTLSGLPNVLSDSNWKALVATAQASISSATNTAQLVAAIEPVQAAITANAAV